MKHATATVLFLIHLSVAVYGQREKELLGKYTYTSFMYTYFLTLSDSGKFTVEEHSDSGLTTTTGAWTIRGRLIKLSPSKSRWDSADFDFPLVESLISVDKQNNLTKLAPKKMSKELSKPRYKIPDKQLRKLTIVDNNFFTVNFTEGSASFKSKKDSLILDSIGKMLNRYPKEFARHEICLISYYSPTEASSDRYIGIKRSQAVKEYLITNYKINRWSFWIQDREDKYVKEPFTWIRIEKWRKENEIIY